MITTGSRATVCDSELSRNGGTVLVLAPTGRDGSLAAAVLGNAGISAKICKEMEDFCSGINDQAGAGILTEEALSKTSVGLLANALDCQPPWSDFPLIVLMSGGEPTGRTERLYSLMQPIGNVTLLERPLRMTTLLTSVKVALRGRARQYQMRDYLAERESSALALKRSNEDLERFAYAASHDLKEPLRLIASYVQLLQKRYAGKLNKEADEYISFAASSAKRMDELISDLLAYSQAGTREQVLEPTECEAVLAWATMNLQMAIRETGAVVTHDPLPTLLSDQTQLVQLFQNLLGNAMKYRGEEAPKIHVSARHARNEWVFSVRDNGIGIEPQYANQIFGVFKRLHGKERPGTGIGLAICQRIVERHGGRIWVESEPAKGSTFYFSLPTDRITAQRES